MVRFRCLPIETAVAEEFRRTGFDSNGNVLRRMKAAGGQFPCRHCLQLAKPGEEMLLGSYNLPRPRGIYWTPSPIFVHAAACPRYAAEQEPAPIVLANPLVSVRAYDTADQCLYELGHVGPGAEAAAALQHALEDGRTAFVNIHTARPGCLLTHVERMG